MMMIYKLYTMHGATMYVFCACWLHLLSVAGCVTMCSVSHSYRCPHAGIFPHHSRPRLYYRCESNLLPAMWCVCPPHTEFDPSLHICTYTPHTIPNDKIHSKASRYRDSGYHNSDAGSHIHQQQHEEAKGIHTTPHVPRAMTTSPKPVLASSMPADSVKGNQQPGHGAKVYKRPRAALRTSGKHKRDKSQKVAGKNVKCQDAVSENDLLKADGCPEVSTEATTPVDRALPTPQPYKQPQEDTVLYDNSLIPAWAIALLVLIAIIMVMAVVMIMY